MSWWGERRSKYGNHKVTHNGEKYDSKKELKYEARDLTFEQKAGEIVSWERQVKFPLKGLNGGKIGDIIVDFLVTLPDGRKQVREIKSKATKTPAWRLKYKAFLDNYPSIDYVIIDK